MLYMQHLASFPASASYASLKSIFRKISCLFFFSFFSSHRYLLIVTERQRERGVVAGTVSFQSVLLVKCQSVLLFLFCFFI